MVVLSRRNAESVIIDGLDGSTRELKVTVLEVKGMRVRLGFEVNTDVPFDRKEGRETIGPGGPPSRPTGGE